MAGDGVLAPLVRRAGAVADFEDHHAAVFDFVTDKVGAYLGQFASAVAKRTTT